ncbi:BZ3500_MvSof-1268-A1-R1_Chr7-1g09080 [Microbotryum saponariae]|uniref:1-phosphatidylinositol-3-phosphate 5-kinase n=1 Tax=Microbotryum saponariae TaxID=289078 RepID=A0A2X0L1S4_9BASI|nr:BZ3501_MvSof-1269-A2-R1_Chr7-1g08784 [Microbotryum saponariae]SDA02759.1 BZ3500_MvSof-1268-A1-R1_Chr7-1g09080 [Microbotryum saponariae]
MSISGVHGEFESFPRFIDEADPETETTLTAKLKRWIVGTSTSTSTQAGGQSNTSSSTATTIPPVASTSYSSAVGNEALRLSTSNATVASSHHHRRNNSTGSTDHLFQSTSSTQSNLDATSPSTPPWKAPTTTSGAGALADLLARTPSVRVTAANTETTRSAKRPVNGSKLYPASNKTWFGGSGSTAGSSRPSSTTMAHGSSTRSSISEALGATTLLNLSTSIPGFPLAREMADDSMSVASLSTVARPSASVAHAIRKLRGEGLSKDYWIKDESSKECFDCETVFSAFRRKHHCRICGQIFCSRCASNIISSARFGQQGYVRVCNLCLSVLEHGGDPAQRSSATTSGAIQDPNSLTTTTSRPGLPNGPYLISGPLEASAQPPQSQFAASQLFPRSETPFNNPSDFDFGPRTLDAHSDTSSRPRTPYTDGGEEANEMRDTRDEEEVPDEDDDDDGDSKNPKRLISIGPFGRLLRRKSSRVVAAASMAIAPFRRSLAEDVDAPIPISTDGTPTQTKTAQEERNGKAGPDVAVSLLSALGDQRATAHAVAFDPTLTTISPNPELEEHASPGEEVVGNGAADEDEDDHESLEPITPHSRHSSHRSQFDAYRAGATRELPLLLATPTLSTAAGTFTLLDDSQFSTEPPQDIGITDAVLRHTHKMLRQMLVSAKIPRPEVWEDVLVPLLVQVAQHTVPDLTGGDDLDVRNYVRIKKIPGGRPRDSEYVDGVVFTKNVLHKKMARKLDHPRVMLFSFPLEYQRIENQLVSIDPLIHQEKEYLHHLVQRVKAQRPHVVLVQKNVSGLALDYLMKEGIVVARNVKPSSIAHVARSTQSDIITSMDKLALEPRLGRCITFRVQTFVHPLIPGARKSLMRFEGCAKNLGCTILLRGEDWETLHRIKGVVEMMVLVAYGARLEGYLLRDELLVATRDRAGEEEEEAEWVDVEEDEKEKETRGLENDKAARPTSTLLGLEREQVSKEIARSLRPFARTALSGSPFVHYPPPYPLAKLSHDDRKLTELRDLREYEETEQILVEEAASRERLSAFSSVVSLPALAGEAAGEASSAESTLGSGDAATGASAITIHVGDKIKTMAPPTVVPHDPTSILQSPEELSRTTEIDEAEARHVEDLLAWDKHLKTTRDSLDPAQHQHLVVLETLGCTQTTKLCRQPTLKSFTFYGKGDVSLGQYVERICRDAGKPCSVQGCGRPLLAHYETWVHGSYRLTIVPEAHPVALDRPELEGHIVMFGYCKICGTRTAMAPMSPEAYRLSFAKYLELSFYPHRLQRTDQVCQHNGHSDHVRYIMCRSITFTISMETIELRDVVAPPRIVYIKPERQLRLRNEEYLTVLRKSTAFWDSIAHRIQSFNYDLVQADRLDDCRAAMAELLAKCEQDRRSILKVLESTYELAQSTNGTGMTSVRRALQNKAVDWEAEWTALEQRIIPTEKDVRRLTTMQLKKLFSVDDVALSPERKTTTASTFSSVSMGGMGELDEKLELANEGAEGAELESVASTVESSTETSAETSLASSTSTLSALGRGAMTSEPAHLDTPALVTPGFVTPISNTHRRMSMTDNESDSTVCADPPLTFRMGNAHLPSPYNVRLSTLEDTSGAESENDRVQPAALPRRTRTGQNVAHLIDLFAEGRSASPGVERGKMAPGSLGLRGAVSTSPPIESPRPTLRRGVSDKSRTKGRPTLKDVLSDGDGSSVRRMVALTDARNVAVSHLSSRSALADLKTSRIPSTSRKPALEQGHSMPKPATEQPRKPLSSKRSPQNSRPTSPQQAIFPNRLSSSPTTSRAPSRSGSRPGQITPGLSRRVSDDLPSSSATGSRSSSVRPTGSTRSSYKGKGKDAASKDDSSETGRSSARGGGGEVGKGSRGIGLGVSRPTASSINKTATPTGSGTSTARRVISHGRHVARIRSHFDRLSRENDQEREKRFGFKKARPVGNVRSTIEVFHNALDAAKEDSDDDEHHSSASDGADDEDDDADDDDDAEDANPREVVPTAAKPLPTTLQTAAQRPVPNLPPAKQKMGKQPNLTSSFNELAQFDVGLPLSSMAEALVQPGLDISGVVAALEEVRSKREESPTRGGAQFVTGKSALSSEAENATTTSMATGLSDSVPVPKMSEGESSGTERGSIIKAISSLWAYRGADFTPLEYPLASSEHLFADNPILVREDEPSSVLAFALSSKAYRGKLEEQAATVSRKTDEASVHGDEALPRRAPEAPADLATVEDTLRKPEAKHFRLQFEDNSTTFFCKIFFAEQFDALRRNCACSAQYIESLARCVKWDSSGGRSKVDFLKTKDDRFIVKEISRLEMDALLRFAPAYFDYMSNAMATGRPTLLAKIFGFYRLGLKNPTTGKTMKLDVLVTENLFYDRQLEQVFDLKGSTRNRLVQVNKDRPHEVLMDENLVEISRRTPLYVREDSKRLLQRAIASDSKFLADLNVMDYSLVVGVDAKKHELVVGIVDFIRTYTWDKRIESWVKDSAFLGGGSNKPGGPTIITPKQYKTRFCEAMNGYFLLSPDPWLTDLSLGVGGSACQTQDNEQ